MSTPDRAAPSQAISGESRPIAGRRSVGREASATITPQAAPAATEPGPAVDAVPAGVSTDECEIPEKDVEVEVGRRRFELLQVVGRGAFGVVWRARDLETGSRDVALKAVAARDAPAFATAAFEAELLQLLSAALPAGAGSQSSHAPRYISHSSSRCAASGGGEVRLAMSFVHGQPIDRWAYGISDEDHKTVAATELLDGRREGAQQGRWRFGRAAVVVKALVAQLAGVFAYLGPIAYHRDVSSHNVLVDFQENGDPDFSLIDFGLAVRSGSWSKEWRSSNLAGDPRYWTPSAWMAFAFGFKYVVTHPNSGFQQQYLCRMDHFGLGVLGLEVLFALWQAGEAYDHPSLEPLLEVRKAWSSFWVFTIDLFQVFHRQGAEVARQRMQQSNEEGVTAFVNHIRALRQAVRTAAVHARSQGSSFPGGPGITGKGVASLLLLLADLVDEKGTAAWQDVPTILSNEDGLGPIPDKAGQSPAGASPVSASRPFARSTAALAPDTAAAAQHGRRDAGSAFTSSTRGDAQRRIRSTGITMDQELIRHEPTVDAVGPGPGPLPSRSSAYTRSYSQVRHASGFV